MSLPAFDFESLARSLLSNAPDLLSRWFPAGRFLGHEFLVGDLSGTPGESLSINIRTGRWSDFATDERGGDLISLFAAIHRMSQGDAARQLTGILGGDVSPSAVRSASVTPIRTPESPEWDGIYPIPADAPPPPTHHPNHGAPVHVARYRDRAGRIIALVYRCEPGGERKQVVPLTFCRRKDGRQEWRWQSLKKPRSLYRVELLDQFPAARVLVVEGEPKCDAANEALQPGIIAISWPNGARSWKHSDWSLLAGRNVIIWPDADEPGIEAAKQIAGQLDHFRATVRVLRPPQDVESGWDIGDAIKAGWDQTKLMGFIDPPEPPATEGGDDDPPGLPLVRVINGMLDRTATAGEAALIRSKLPIYQRGRSLVRPIRSEVPASRGRTTLAAGLAEIGGAAMIDRLCRVARWERFDARAKDWRRIDPPAAVGATILSRVGDWTFPPVAGVITTPTMRPDGSLLTQAGYDAQTRLYHAVDAAIDIHRYVVPNPTKEDAVRALADLTHLLKGFPTVTETDKSVALSALISPVIRGALTVVPMHALRASTAGTGKTYLVDVSSAIATGRPCPVATVAKTEEETEKRLAGLLLAAFPLICLDNVNGELGGDLLCQAIERPIVQIRPLGTSDIIEIESRATIFATGNAMRVRGDMVRRVLICNLDAGVERPELRKFDFDPVETVLSNRARYVGACLTIVLAHIRAGFPEEIGPFASFEDWSRYVRSALMWLGCSDPCISLEAAREDDPDLSDLRDLLSAWVEEFGDIGAFTCSEIVDKMGEKEANPDDDGREGPPIWKHPRMREIIIRISNGKTMGDTRRLGNSFKDREGRVADGYRMRRSGASSGGVIRWNVSKVAAKGER